MTTGLKRGTVELYPHEAEWEKEGRDTCHKIKEILKDDIIAVEHVGSTSIKHASAKPIIDIAVGIKDYETIMKHNAELEKKGIIYRRNDEREVLYIMGDIKNDVRTHHIHAVIYDGEEWQKYILFRDYMNAHPEDAEEYTALKMRLAEKYKNNRKEYTASKSDFICSVLKKAIKEKEGKGHI